MQPHHMQLLLQQQQQQQEDSRAQQALPHQQTMQQLQPGIEAESRSGQQTPSLLSELQGVPVSSTTPTNNSLPVGQGPHHLQGNLPPNLWLQQVALGMSYNPTQQQQQRQQQQQQVLSATGSQLTHQLSPTGAALFAAEAAAAGSAGGVATLRAFPHTNPTDTPTLDQHHHQQQQQMLHRSSSTADHQQQQQQGGAQRRRGRRGAGSGSGPGVACSHLEVNGGMDLAASSRLLRTSSGKVLR
jgi:hypothetical protein